MHKLLPVLVFLATASVFCRGPMAIELPSAADMPGTGKAVVLVGGMGGGTGGGMGGVMGSMTGGGMGGMTGGGMGGMTGGGMHNTTCVSRPTTGARWPPPPAPFAVVRHARVPPDIAARSNRERSRFETPLVATSTVPIL